jgi:NDP-sugar pyrophosphorylase family protein
MKAMLLAAGRGVRMAPLTPRWSKATLPVLDQPLVLRLVRSLAAQGVQSVVVNAYQNADRLREALRAAPIPVEVSLEPELRGSGGGIRQARPFLEGSSPFLVLNADMCIDVDLADLLRAHVGGGAMATLALRDDPRNREFGTLGYAEDGVLCRIADRLDRGFETGCGLFTGVHVMQPAIFDHMPDRPEFDIVRDVYIPWLHAGERIGTWLQPQDATWWPVGCPRELLDANLRALEQTLEAQPDRPDDILAAEDARIEGKLRGPAWVGAGAHIPPDAHVGPWVVIGAHARVPGAERVEESLLLPASRPRAQEPLRRAIGFGEEVWMDG